MFYKHEAALHPKLSFNIVNLVQTSQIYIAAYITLLLFTFFGSYLGRGTSGLPAVVESQLPEFYIIRWL